MTMQEVLQLFFIFMLAVPTQAVRCKRHGGHKQLQIVQ